MNKWLSKLSVAVVMLAIGSFSARADQMTAGELFESANLGKYSIETFNASFGQFLLNDHLTRNFIAKSDFTHGLTAAIQTYGGFGSRGSRGSYLDGTAGETKGYTLGNVGLYGTLGYRVAKELEIGALFGYSYNHLSGYKYSTLMTDDGPVEDFDHKVTDNTLRMGLYGKFDWDNFFFDTAPTFGIHILDSEMKGNIGGGYNLKMTRDRTGFDFAWFNRLGYTFEAPAGILITPQYSLAFSYFHDPKSKAKLYVNGDRGPDNDPWKDYDSLSLLQNVGVNIGKVINASDCISFLPQFNAGWEHEYIVMNSLKGDDGNPNYYAANILQPDQDRAVLGVNLTASFYNRYDLTAGYNAKIAASGATHQFNLGIGVKF